MNILALDVGEARVGLAVGRLGSGFAFGRGYITRSTLAEDIKELEEKIKAERVSLLVIGLPTRSDGGDSEQTKRVREFAKALSKAFEDEDIMLVFEDERFTTKIATQNIVKSGVSKKKRQEKGRIDEASAILILESYLARQSSS